MEPRVSLPETSPTLRWTGKVGDASVFQVWGSRGFVCDTSADKLSARAIPCAFLGFPPDGPGWQFYQPTSGCVLPYEDVTFDESVPFYHPLPSTVPVEVAGDSGAARGAASRGVEPGGAELGGAESEGTGFGGGELGDAEPGGAETEGAEPAGVEIGGAEPEGAESEGAESGGAEPRAAGAGATRDTAAPGAGGIGFTPRAGGAGGAAVPDLAGTGAGGSGGGAAGAGGTGAGGAGAGGAGAVDSGAGGAGAGSAGGTMRPRPYFVPILQQPASPLPAPSPYSEQTGGLTECREPASHPASPLRTGRRVPRPRPPIPGTHIMALRPSYVPLYNPLPPPSESSLPAVPDPESDCALAMSPTVSRLLATVVTDPSFESTAASALIAELVDLAAACRLNYATALVLSPSLPVLRPSGVSVLLARTSLRTSRRTLSVLQLLYLVSLPCCLALWETRMHQTPDLCHVDDLVFATADTEALTLVKLEIQKRHTCTDLGEQRSYLGLQIIRDRARRTITLTQSHLVHQVLQRFGFQFSSPQPTRSTSHSLSAPPLDESVEPIGPYPELVGCLMYLMTCTRPDLTYPLSLFARYVALGRHRKVHWDTAKRVLRYLCSTSGMGLVLGGRGSIVLTGHVDASWVDDSATQRSSQGYTLSLGSGSVSWWSSCSSLILSSSCAAEIYAGAMAAQELRWLTYLLTDLGEQPRSPLVLYVDNKAMIALCQEHRVEHRTKHIALRYLLARELQQHGQLRLAYVATRANTADVFTKALPPGDH
ncbi:unnamed protein product [Closterium sp. NIES-53]